MRIYMITRSMFLWKKQYCNNNNISRRRKSQLLILLLGCRAYFPYLFDYLICRTHVSRAACGGGAGMMSQFVRQEYVWWSAGYTTCCMMGLIVVPYIWYMYVIWCDMAAMLLSVSVVMRLPPPPNVTASLSAVCTYCCCSTGTAVVSIIAVKKRLSERRFCSYDMCSYNEYTEHCYCRAAERSS